MTALTISPRLLKNSFPDMGRKTEREKKDCNLSLRAPWKPLALRTDRHKCR